MEIDYGKPTVLIHYQDSSDKESDGDSIWDSSSITPPFSPVARLGDGLRDGSVASPRVVAQTSERRAINKQHPYIPSEFPRLRRTHLTDGYREGLSSGKAEESIAQHGFNSGFPIGAAIGLRVGFVLRGLKELSRLDAQHKRNALRQEESRYRLESDSTVEVDSVPKPSTASAKWNTDDVIKTKEAEPERAVEFEKAKIELLDVSNTCLKELQNVGLLSEREESVDGDIDEDEDDADLDLRHSSSRESSFGQTQDHGFRGSVSGNDSPLGKESSPSDHQKTLQPRATSNQTFDIAPDGISRPSHDAQGEQQDYLGDDWLQKLHTINKWMDILQHRSRQTNVDLRFPLRSERRSIARLRR